jgi:glycosyltransferase involved in cell wall biosynthesis
VRRRKRRGGQGKPGVLVVSHEASRTGAPRVAIAIVRALPESLWDRRVVLRWPGPLRSEFNATGARVFLEPLRRVRVTLRLWPPTRRVAAVLEQVAAAIVIVALRPDVIWCNTVLSACYIRPALLLGKRVVLHAHEPDDRMTQVLGRYRLRGHWRSTVLVGCAPKVCAGLAAATGRPVSDVRYIPSVPDGYVVVKLARGVTPPLPEHDVLIGACGPPNPGKGADLWLTMVEEIATSAADLRPHFVWIGGDAPPEFREWAARTEMADRVTYTGSLENPYPLLAALDVFTLTSRADSFPLVVLEAMHLARAVVAFDVGDVAEQVGDTGCLVPVLAVDQAAEAVVALLRDPDERTRMGVAAAARAREHFAIEDFATTVQSVAAGSAAIPADRKPRR